MRRLFVAALALSCLVAASPSFARGGIGHGGMGRAGIARDPYRTFAPIPRAPAMGNRIPAPLAAPAQAPVINGPMSQPSFRGLTGIGE
jgi:hypothetical protein